MTTRGRIEEVLRGAFLGKRIEEEMWERGELKYRSSFTIGEARIEDEVYLAVYSDSDRKTFELMKIGKAITLADKGAMEFTTEEGSLLKFALKEGEN